MKLLVFYDVITEKGDKLAGYAVITGKLTLAFTYFLEAINQVERVKK